ncbi:MAG TPA: VOC family protein [Ignavibacteria bacterium]|nr:VOC family protein [Ignavibacteria bacterium]
MAKNNPVVYFEIPINDMERATIFYKEIFGYEFEIAEIHGNQMAFFPFGEGMPGASGALAKGEIYKPTKDGVVVYLGCDNIDDVLEKITSRKGVILFPKTEVENTGFVAEIEDSEGNRIALFEKLRES